MTIMLDGQSLTVEKMVCIARRRIAGAQSGYIGESVPH